MLCSCSNIEHKKLRDEMTVYYGKELILPLHKSSNKLKISTYIKGDCSKCIDELIEWKKWIAIDNSNVDFYFYFYAFDEDIMNEIDTAIVKLNYPIIYDEHKSYLTKNGLNEKDKVFQTFLLDRNNHILLIGNPIGNPKLSKLYHREINKRKS